MQWVFLLLLFWFLETGFICSFGSRPGTSSYTPGWSGTHRDPPASALQVLGLKACTTTVPLENWTLVLRINVGQLTTDCNISSKGFITWPQRAPVLQYT
ncbi:hypothetical protein LEMLEM_LOCUS14489, partial [Lemmus lemmus]